MIHHPESNLLFKFSKGELSSALSSMISAHLNQCLECQSSYRKSIEEDSHIFSSLSGDLTASEIDSAFDSLMNKIDEKSNRDYFIASNNVSVSIAGETFELPDSFGFLKDQEISWKEFGKKNAIAPVITSKEGNFYLIYIGPGESVPEHSHTNIEYSYVAAGSYSDGISTYQTGDFSFTNQTHRHSPVATSSDGCLVISWVEGRLNYFKGILSPLNSLLWWYLHRA